MTNKGWYAIKSKQQTNLNLGPRSKHSHWKYFSRVVPFQHNFKTNIQAELIEMVTADRVQILVEAVGNSQCTNTLGEGMNPSILPPLMRK